MAQGTQLPSVADLLSVSAVRHGCPVVVAGRDRLDQGVRWVHASDSPDVAGHLRGGELILSTGVAFGHTGDELERYADSLVQAGAVGLMLGPGRRPAEPTARMERAFEQRRTPLIVLRRPVSFVHVTETVHALILQERVTTLQRIQRADRLLTALCLGGADAAEIVETAARLSGCPAVLEDLLHRALTYATAGPPAVTLLRDWAARSRAVRGTPQSAEVSGSEGWIVAPVAVRGEIGGRLVLVPPGPPSAAQVAIAERAAAALALGGLMDAGGDALARQSHRSVLSDAISNRYDSTAEMHARTAALGVPTAGRSLVAVVVEQAGEVAGDVAGERPGEGAQAAPDSRSDRAAERIAAQLREAGLSGLVAGLGPGRVGVLLALPSARDRAAALGDLVAGLNRAGSSGPAGRWVVGAGPAVDDIHGVSRSFSEAGHAAAAAPTHPDPKPWYETGDIRLPGLLRLLRGDPRVMAFTERMLGPLLDHDHQRGTDLLAVLRAYLTHPGNKSAAAAAIHLSRQALSRRLATVERVLGADLDSAEATSSLHAALIVLDAGVDRQGTRPLR
jgi:PucR family transcriptional regulator, purine catabolism regulatory protein